MASVDEVNVESECTPFEEAAMFALRLGTSLIMSKACKEASKFESDVELGLEDLDLPPEVRLQVMMDYVSLKDRWDLLFSTPLCVD